MQISTFREVNDVSFIDLELGDVFVRSGVSGHKAYYIKTSEDEAFNIVHNCVRPMKRGDLVRQCDAEILITGPALVEEEGCA